MTQIKLDTDNRIVGLYFGADKKQGWKEVQAIPEAEEREGYQAVAYYRNGKVEYEYEEIPPEPKQEIELPKDTRTYDERVDTKIRERYSMSNELAILRQRDTKSLEFSMYNDYCEQCKKEVKQEIAQEKKELEEMQQMQ